VAVSSSPSGIVIEGGGGYGTLNFGATSVTGGTGAAVVVFGHGGPEPGQGGRILFGGPITAASGGGGIDLLDNAGSTIAFTGTLSLSTGPNPAFTATGGGTVTATGAGSTLSGSGEGALVIEDTTIGAAGVTFQSLSSSSTDNSNDSGIDSGIILDDTGSSAGVTVTGTGTPGSGGTIENSTGPGIQLTSTSAPSFTDMVISGNAVGGIDGSDVTGLTLDGCTLSGNGTGAFNDGLNFSDDGNGRPGGGLTGTVSIINSTITGSAFDNATISDTSGTLNLTVTDSTFSSGGGPTIGGSGLLVSADGTVSVTGSTFTDNDGDAFAFGTNSAATGIDSVTFSDNTVNGSGGGVAITLYGNSTNAIAVDGNNIQNAGGDAIGIDQVEGPETPTGSGVLTGTIDGNTIGAPTAAGSGGTGGVFVEGWGTAETLAITGNHIYQSGPGITFINEGSPVMNLTITGNTIPDPGGDGGIYGQDGTPVIERGGGGGAGGTVCAVITGNSIGGSGQGETDIQLDQNDAWTINLPGYTGGPGDASAVESFLAGNNDGDGTPTAVATVSGSGGGFVGASGC
jgi:hypothetical protein